MTTQCPAQTPLDIFKLIINVYVVVFVCAFGITGNVLSIVVLGRDRSIRRTTGFLLQMLAVADTTYLVACLLFQSAKTVHDLTLWLPVTARYVWPSTSTKTRPTGTACYDVECT